MDYNIKANDFEGPLDLLLHLIKKSDMDIQDIKISEITKQYLEVIDQMEEMNLTIASEYLVLAAELLEIKAKSLLPNETIDDEDEFVEDAKENLIRRLLEYERYKEITTDFKNLEQERNKIFTKYPENLKEYQIDEIIKDEDVNISTLLDAFNKFLDKKEEEKPLTTKVTKKEISVKDRKKYIKNILKNKKEVNFTNLFEVKQKNYIVATFLAILEMAKNKEIIINQKHNFEDIILTLGSEKNE